MVIRNGFSVKTGKSETVKVCGNCRCVSFGLNREEAEFLKETVQYHGAERVLRWIKAGFVKVPRGDCLGSEKVRAVDIILKHEANCKVAAAKVLLMEKQF